MRRWNPARSALAVASVLAALTACGRSAPPSLLLVSIDTLRPDHLGLGGGGRATSPNLDALAAESLVFDDAYSAAGWTLPSVATLLTGLAPREHGATSYQRGLRDRLPTLASLLARRGYDARGFVSHVLLGPEYGLDRGFARYDTSVLSAGRPDRVATAEALTARVLDDLAAHPLEPPFFLWVYYFDPHFRYLRHPDQASSGDRPLDRYDGEIRYTDQQIGRLLDFLRARHLYSNCVVVATSDHGEEFHEHGGRFHENLHQEVVRVPLLIRAPSLAPGRSSAVAEQIDVLPTVLALLGAEIPAGLPGRNLLTASDGERPVFFERDLPLPFRQRGVLLGSHKLLVVDLVPVEVDESRPAPGRTEWKPPLRPGTSLYDLAADPGEQRDLYAAGDPIAERLLALLLANFREGVGPYNPVRVSEELERKLRELGYLR